MNVLSLQKGDKLPGLTKGPITQLDLVRYAGASGDFNPIHLVESAAHEAGLDGTIAHGMLTMAYIGQMITEFVGNDGQLVEFSVRFRAMVKPGDTVFCSGEITRVEPQDYGETRVTVAVYAQTDKAQTAVKGSAILLFYPK